MDLPYPSRPNLDVQDNILGGLDKRMRSTIWSVKDIGKNEQNLSQSLRDRLIKLIQKDRVTTMARKLTDNCVNLETEIGCKGSRWTLLHYCARWNAIDCMEYILREQYKASQEEYTQFVNAKTIQGYTALMVSILYDSGEFLKLLLEYGGSDIFLINNNKMTAYQLAVSNKNELAIKLLIEYEHTNKHSAYINTKLLKEPYMLPEEDKHCCCITILQNFYRWACREPKDKQLFYKGADSLLAPRPSLTERRSILDNGFFFDPAFTRTASSICSDAELVKGYQIEWYRASELFASKDIKLFDNFNPFEIKQLNFALKHQLTVIQCLARQPWITRRIVNKDTDQKGAYTLDLYPKGFTEKIVVDDFVPCLRDKKQPMFLMNMRQLWPMLLQKAWVKTYGCYVNTRNVQPKKMLSQITGFPTETFTLSEHKEGLFENLRSLNKNGYIVILTTKTDSKLQEEGQGSQSFSILNFYDKDSKKLYLVNCPFLLAKWKQKDKNEALGLRLIKAHYNNHNQMSIWLDNEKINEYFQSFTVCYINENYLRSQIKGFSKEFFFFKFQILDDEEFEFILKLYDYTDNDLKEIQTQSLQIGWNETISAKFFSQHPQSFNKLTYLKFPEGQYFCKIELPNKNTLKSIALAMHGTKKLNFEYIDQQIGKIQWLYLVKDKLMTEDFQETGDGLQFTSEKLSDYYVVVLRNKDQSKNGQRHYMEFDSPGFSQIVQGYQETPNKVLFEAIDKTQSYVIFRVAEGSCLQSMGVRFICN